MKEYLEVGKIINTHGVAGAVKVEPWCDSPEVLAGLVSVYVLRGGTYSRLSVKRAFVQKRFTVLFLCGVETVEDAAAMRGTVLYAHRDDIPLPDGSVLISDILGLDVIDEDTGRVYGKLTDVLNLGAGDIYEIDTGNGKALMPAVDEFVCRVDTDAGIFIRPIEGMLE